MKSKNLLSCFALTALCVSSVVQAQSPADEINAFFAEAAGIENEVKEIMSEYFGVAYTNTYFQALSDNNGTAVDAADFKLLSYQLDKQAKALPLGQVQKTASAVMLSMANAEELAEAASLYDAAKIRCSQTIPQQWRDAVAEQMGTDAYNDLQTARNSVCRAVLVIADIQAKIEQYNAIAEDGYPLFYLHKKNKVKFKDGINEYKRTIQYWLDLRVTLPTSSELLKGDVSQLELTHKSQYKYSSKDPSSIDILKMLANNNGKKDGLCFPVLKIPGSKASLCANVKSISTSSITLHTKARFDAYGQTKDVSLGNVTVPAPFGYLADLQDMKNKKVDDMKAKMIKKIEAKLPYQGKALEAMQAMAE